MTHTSIAIVGLLFASGCSAPHDAPVVDAPDVADAGDASPPESLPGADDTATGTPGTGLTSTFTLGSTLVTTDFVNLRSGPSVTDSIVLVIPPATLISTVFHTSPSHGFYNVLYGEHVGWSSGLYLERAVPPAAHTLPTTVVAHVVEPTGSGVDDHGHSYVDQNYWNFCGPGAVTAALAFFTSHVTGWPAASFTEPYGPHSTTTYWHSTNGHAYLLHIAMQVQPPSFTRPGLASFSSYPTTGANLPDSRDVLNWEGSGHSPSWRTFFYQDVPASGLTAATLHADVKRDIYGGHAVLATVNTAYLPNWSRALGHSILIIGYDDNAGTYAFVDTCGARCNGSSQATNGGVWHISQSAMFHAITSHGVGYAR